MPWKPQGGGPWGGGQGPWGGGSGGGGGGGRGGGPQPPDLEEMLRRGQERFRRSMPGGFGGGKAIFLIVIAAIVVWGLSGIYQVQPGERGVLLLFGKAQSYTTGPGLHIWYPSPIGEVLTPDVQRVNTITIGYRGSADRSTVRDVRHESLMLTGDQNVIDIDFVVQWRIKNAERYLFQLRDPIGTIKIAAESALREVIGQTNLDEALTVRRQVIENTTQKLLQKILDNYGSGVLIAQVKLQKVDPPQQVIDAFNDVQRARQDQERLVNEALAYKNDVLPRAKGRAEQIVAEANAYKEQVVKDAEGEAARFTSVFNSYKNAKNVTEKRMFIERMQQVMQDANKVIVDPKVGGPGVVPYLPLPAVKNHANSGSSASAGASAGGSSSAGSSSGSSSTSGSSGSSSTGSGSGGS